MTAPNPSHTSSSGTPAGRDSSVSPAPLDTPAESRALERYYMLGLLCMLVLIVAFPVYKFGEPARRARTQEAMRAENVSIGGTMFAQHCASCHGDNATGGRGFPTLGSREFLASVSDRQLQWLISGGVPGTPMTAYDMDLGGPFTAQEIVRLVTYLRSLEEGAPSVPGWYKGAPAPPRLVAGTASTVDASMDSAVLGFAAPGEDVIDVASAQVYAVRCAACHGADGKGTPVAPAISALTAGRIDSITTIISSGVPGTAMVAFSNERGGPLDSTTIHALVGWLQRQQAARQP